MYNEAVLSFLKNSKWQPGTSFQLETGFLAGQLRHPFLCLFTARAALLSDDQMTRDVQPSCICCQSIYAISHSITVSNAGVMLTSALPHVHGFLFPNDTGFSMK